MSHMTKIPGAPDADEAIAGMAHFPGTGPEDKTCGDCLHRGFWYEKSNGKMSYTNGCEKFKRLTGKRGPVVQVDWRACRHFVPGDDK